MSHFGTLYLLASKTLMELVSRGEDGLYMVMVGAATYLDYAGWEGGLVINK